MMKEIKLTKKEYKEHEEYEELEIKCDEYMILAPFCYAVRDVLYVFQS